jgi:ribose transport system permease protein
MNRLARSFVRSESFPLLVVVTLAAIGLGGMRPEFTKEFNLYVLLFDISGAMLVAFSQMVVIATGGMSLAVGATGGLSAVLAAGLMVSYGVPIWAAVLLALLAGIAMGFANGYLTVKTGINPFIITLATSAAYEGTNFGITSSNPYYELPMAFTDYGQARTSLLPHPMIISIIVAIVLGIVLYRTVLGRSILAVGGNARAAEMAGIPVRRTIVIAHVISGFLAALAGLMLMARLGNGSPTIGSQWLLPSFATVLIGGAVLSGGKVSITGAILGCALLSMISNGLVIFRADPYWVTFLIGALILAAVGLNRLRSSPAGSTNGPRWRSLPGRTAK